MADKLHPPFSFIRSLACEEHQIERGNSLNILYQWTQAGIE